MPNFNQFDRDLEFEPNPPLRIHKQPLPIHRIFANRNFNSNAALFRLPIELLQLIVDYVYAEYLFCPSQLHACRTPCCVIDGLALVNRDCYQIARSMQLFDVALGPRNIFCSIVPRLLAEVSSVSRLPATSLPALGPLVRSLQVYASPTWVGSRSSRSPYWRRRFGQGEFYRMRNQSLDTAEFLKLSESLAHTLPLLTSSKPIDVADFVQNVSAFLMEHVFGELEAFKWKAHTHGFDDSGNFATQAYSGKLIRMNLRLSTAIFKSPIKVLTLGPRSLNDDLIATAGIFKPTCQIDRVSFEETSWKVNHESTTTTPENNQQGRCFTLFLSSTAHSVTRLMFKVESPIWLDLKQDQTKSSRAFFPNLVFLSIEANKGTISTSTLHALVPNSPKSMLKSFRFVMPISHTSPQSSQSGDDPIVSDFFSQLGCIKTLKNLEFKYRSRSSITALLNANPQIARLLVERPRSNESYLEILRPGTFTCLNTLCVALRDIVPEEVFQTIGKLHTLQYLYLGYRKCWRAEHNVILGAFSKLQQLKTLHFRGESYYYHPRLPWQSYFDLQLSNSQLDRIFDSEETRHVEVFQYGSRSLYGFRMNGWWFGHGSKERNDRVLRNGGDGIEHLDALWNDDSEQFRDEHAARMRTFVNAYFAQHPCLNQVVIGSGCHWSQYIRISTEDGHFTISRQGGPW